MDVADYSSVEAAFAVLSQKFTAIDGIINNAAVLYESKAFTGDPIVDLDLERFYKTMEINTYGPIHVLKKFMPLVYKGDNQCVINITTEGVRMRSEGSHYIAYACSKSAMNMYSQKIRNYLASREDTKRIRLFMVHPGRMFTIMGVENAQIQPSEPACGIWDIIERKIDPVLDIPFINYKGEVMPYI
jgi:NAD(P)-dependent dehydrogenase (short-subunit alcohol dehydrogenase family)